jgi:tetratricopeptide (TPR) repeat protein
MKIRFSARRTLVAVLAFTSAVVPAHAQQWNDCESSQKSPDVRIAACTRLLDTGRLSNAHRAMVYNNRAIALQDKGELDRAIADYSEAIKIDPLGKNKNKDDGYDFRVTYKSKDVRRQAESHPMTAQAYSNRGTVWYDKRDYDRAIADYSEAIKIDPKDATSYDSRGLAWHSKGNYDRAIADYGEALRIEPRYTRVYGDRGFAYAKMGDYDRAIADYSEAIKIGPKDATFYLGRGYAWHCKGDYDRAIANYDQAIRLNPKLALAYSNRGHAWKAKGNLARANADYEQAKQLDQ